MPAFGSKTLFETKPLRAGQSPRILENTFYPDTGLLVCDAALCWEEPRPAANAFGGGRSGFGPCRTTQSKTRVVACAFASQVRRSRA
jgi:hypothetical protein